MPRLKTRKEAPPEMIRTPADSLALEEGCYFDPEEAERPIRFIESFCCHSKGEWAGQPLTLLDWQKDYNRRLYGWRRPNGTRRFRVSYREVPKKNGKSTEISGKSLYHGIADGEPAAEVYINAYDLSQARIIFDEAARMVRSSPLLSRVLTVVPSAKRITHGPSESFIRALSADVASKDGVSASYTIFDELHRQAKSDMWDIFEFAGAARRQPLLEAITTAGYDRNSICYRQHDYTKKVNSGLIPDTAHLGQIYAADPADDIEDPAVWAKANPSMGVTIQVEDFRRELRKALENPTQLNNFLRLRLGIWTNASERFLRRDQWDACGVRTFTLEDLDGLPCYGGLDLSLTTDLTAFALIFIASDGTVFVVLRFWAPEERADYRESRDRVPYRTWARQGFLTLTPGSIVDYEWMKREIVELHQRFGIRKIFIDKTYATQVALQLRDVHGIPVEFLGQGFLSLAAPTRELERLTVSTRLAHGNNPVLNWMADNAVATVDPAGNAKLDKGKSTERIDGLYALIDALAAWMTEAEDNEPSVYESRGVVYL